MCRYFAFSVRMLLGYIYFSSLWPAVVRYLCSPINSPTLSAFCECNNVLTVTLDNAMLVVYGSVSAMQVLEVRKRHIFNVQIFCSYFCSPRIRGTAVQISSLLKENILSFSASYCNDFSSLASATWLFEDSYWHLAQGS